MFIKQQTLWQTVKPVIIFGPLLGTPVFLISMWFTRHIENLSTAKLLEGLQGLPLYLLV